MLRVEELREQELSGVWRLEKEIFSDAWSEQGLRETWRQPGAVIFGAWDGDTLAGYAIVYYVLDEAEIMRIAVEDARRRQGAAGQMLLRIKGFCAEKGIGKIFLEVRESNAPAIAFYRKHGFQADGIRKNFYTNPAENAILMSSEVKK